MVSVDVKPNASFPFQQGGEEGEEGERKGDKGEGCSRQGPRPGDEDGDELHNYSAQYGESEGTPGNSSCGHTGSTVRPTGTCANHRYGNNPCQPASQPVPQRSFHNADDDSLPPDQVRHLERRYVCVCVGRCRG